MSEFTIVNDLRVGAVIEVSGSAIRVELDGAISELTRTHRGRVYSIGQFASIVKIHFGRTVLFAFVRLLRMRTELDVPSVHQANSALNDARILEADLFAEGTISSGTSLDLHRGVSQYPLPGQAVYLMTQDELQCLYQGAEQSRIMPVTEPGPAIADPLLHIGDYVGSAASHCYADMNKLFGMHCAVLGSTGSGKSGTVAAILHALLEHRASSTVKEPIHPTIIVIDPHGEYCRCFGNRSSVFRAYTAAAVAADVESTELKLPYWLLSAEEFREMVIGKTEYEATSENNIVLKALCHSRLVTRGWVEKSKKWSGAAREGIAPGDHRYTKKDRESQVIQYDADTPDRFELDEFVNHIRDEQGVRIKDGEWQQMAPSDFKAHASVLDKLKVLRLDPRLRFMMQDPGRDTTLVSILQQFVGELPHKVHADIRVIDISGLPNEVAGVLTAAIARLLFQFKIWQTATERHRNPIVLVCEEAHRYVPNAGLAEYAAAQKAVRRIAKEGRKYGLGLMLVSQRPADVERTVLSQCNSWLVMRLSNATDQEYVSRFLPDSLAGMSRLLPSLARREAIFVGEAAAVPARIKIRHLTQDQLPRSNDVPFADGWAQGHLNVSEIETIVNRWTRYAVDEKPPSTSPTEPDPPF